MKSGRRLKILFDHLQKTGGTAEPRKAHHTEHQNLTMRMAIRQIARLTNAFSKWPAYLGFPQPGHLAPKVGNHAHCNFVCIHLSLRITPAMVGRRDEQAVVIDRHGVRKQ